MAIDTDLDSLPDWEEALWGMDLNKKDTDGDGVDDGAEVAKLKKEPGSEGGNEPREGSTGKLTETDKFSREFFSTIAALSQSGVLDQAAIEQIGVALAERIESSPQRKVFSLSDIKVSANDNTQSIKKYKGSLENLQKKYPVKLRVTDVFQEFIIDEDNNVDADVLSKLDTIIVPIKSITTDLLKIEVPRSLAPLHLDFVNVLQGLSENLSDIQLYNTDVILSLSGISQYNKNITALESANSSLENAFNKKLSN